jgi:hypothetical protein
MVTIQCILQYVTGYNPVHITVCYWLKSSVYYSILMVTIQCILQYINGYIPVHIAVY